MIDIQFPSYPFKIKEEKSKSVIFDPFRKQWVVLTPEEWVRQNFLQYLVQHMQYPASCIAVEREIKIGEVKRRFDIVVFKNAIPWMIVECKEMQVQLNEAALHQVLNYNSALQVQHIVITNGVNTFGLTIHQNNPEWISVLPVYTD